MPEIIAYVIRTKGDKASKLPAFPTPKAPSIMLTNVLQWLVGQRGDGDGNKIKGWIHSPKPFQHIYLITISLHSKPKGRGSIE